MLGGAFRYLLIIRGWPKSEALGAIRLKENSDPELHDLCGKILWKLNAMPSDEFLARASTMFCDVVDLT